MSRKQNKELNFWNKPLLNSKKNISQFLISGWTVKYNSEAETLDDIHESLILSKNASSNAQNTEGQPYLEKRTNYSKQWLLDISSFAKGPENERASATKSKWANIHQMIIKLNSEDNWRQEKTEERLKQANIGNKSQNRNLKPNFKTKEPEKLYSPKRFQPSFHRRKMYIESQMQMSNGNKRFSGNSQTAHKYKIYYPGKNLSKENAFIEDKSLIERVGLK